MTKKSKITTTTAMALISLFMLVPVFFIGCLPDEKKLVNLDAIEEEPIGTDVNVIEKELITGDTNIIEEELLYGAYLEKFLVDTGLTFNATVKNGFIYYELYDEEQLQGFVFLGEEEGWAGPIHLFVKTDKAGVIQQVAVWHHTETPIYVIEMAIFLESFTEHFIMAELIWQKDLDGLTGATITAESIIAAVHEPGLIAYQKGIFLN